MPRDPVCRMPVRAESGLTASHADRTFFFCSKLCRAAFLGDPAKYAVGAPEADVPRRIAYFSMEVAAESSLPGYSGGLGVLAADTLRSCADLGIPIIGVTLLHRKGYFDQSLDAEGSQAERPVAWDPASRLRALPTVVRVGIEGRSVAIRAWEYAIAGSKGDSVPLLFLDSDLDDNDPRDRELAGSLYGGDERYRFAQEIVLGVGGVRMLRALGHFGIDRFHLNEGHSALLVFELLREMRSQRGAGSDFDWLRNRCVFTTHTPVAAGHDSFDYDLAEPMLGPLLPLDLVRMLGGCERLNLTELALNASGYVNGVAKRHGEVSRRMFPGYDIESITNGVHSATWTCPAFAKLFDRYVPGWARDPFSLRYAIGIPSDEIWGAHQQAKQGLVDDLRRRGLREFRPDVLTIGFARRATAYKRADLVFADTERLAAIARNVGRIQLVFAGKAHPKDDPGKELIRRIVRSGRALQGRVPVAYLEQHDLELAKLLVSGVDLWLNTPRAPLEASGTSGMKAAHNGVPSLSTLDGWWVEGCIEGVTGWSIGGARSNSAGGAADDERDARELYGKLEDVIVPLFYRERERWIEIARQTIALNASFFNTHRMVQQYAANAYL